MKSLHPYKIQIIFIFGILFFTYSCKKDSTDFSKFDDYSASTEFSIPLFNTNINLQNITLNDSFNSTIDNSGLIHFVYRQDSLFTYKITDFYNFENVNKTNINTSLGEITINNSSSSKKSTLQDLTANFSSSTKVAFDSLSGKNVIENILFIYYFIF
jgi:hypothetical protein